MQTKHTKEEVEKVLSEAEEAVMIGQSNWPGMMYEEGVADTIRWLLGDTNNTPMEDVDD